jgi:hypothetical protein
VIGDWVIERGDKTFIAHQVKRMRQAILETVIVDLVLNKETKSK